MVGGTLAGTTHIAFNPIQSTMAVIDYAVELPGRIASITRADVYAAANGLANHVQQVTTAPMRGDLAGSQQLGKDLFGLSMVALPGPKIVGGMRFARAGAAEGTLPAVGGHLPNAGGVIRQFTQQGDQVYYRVFSGDSTVGSFLTAIPPRSSAFAREALALPPGNQATFVQEVLVPNGTPLVRSRALPQPDWRRARGGAEQFELLQHIPTSNFGPGRPLP